MQNINLRCKLIKKFGVSCMFHEGQKIGSYKLLTKIGKGGFGEVWLAEKRSELVTKKVAVKLPLEDQVNLDTIRQEAELWEQASGHANVLPIIDADIIDGQVLIVSEYAEGGSLHDKLRREGKLSIKQAVEMTIGILNGLEFLHNKRIIHRDIKPQNILLQGDTPRLADFGISRAMQTTAISSTIIGTDSYMSPETFEGKRSVQTDIWAVGVVLYQLLQGSLPFPQEHPSERMFAIIQKDFEPLPAEVPFGLQQIIKKALAKLPENRFESASQMRDDLQHFVSNVSSPVKVQVKIPGIQLNKQNVIVPILKENSTLTAKVSPNLKRDAIDTRIPKIRLIHSIGLGMQRFFNWVHLILPEWVLPCFLLLIILSIGANVCGRKPEVINDSSIVKTDSLTRNSNLVKANSSTNLWVNANNSSVTANIVTDTERVNNNKSDNLTKLNIESKNEGTPKPKSIEIPNPIDFETQNESTPKPNELPKPIEIERKNESTPEPKTISTPHPTPKTTTTSTSKLTGPVSGGVVNGKATSLPRPPYPAAAKAVRAAGTVSVQVLIDEDGNVISAEATSGHPLLRAAAEQAARGAKFSPTLFSGQRVKVSGVVVYNFVAQ